MYSNDSSNNNGKPKKPEPKLIFMDDESDPNSIREPTFFDVVNSAASSAFETTHKVWLASLGAISSMDSKEKRSRVFDHLVQEGKEKEVVLQEQTLALKNEAYERFQPWKIKAEQSVEEWKPFFFHMWGKGQTTISTATDRFRSDTSDNPERNK